MRRRAAPDLRPGGRVCYGCQQNIGGRGGATKRLEPALARHPEVGRGGPYACFAPNIRVVLQTPETHSFAAGSIEAVVAEMGATRI
ncbi:MAG: hypothetical protein RLZZ563_38 [Pseudomonadota bacterium]